MPQNMLVAQGFLPENSMKLARFLVDVAEPHVSWHDSQAIQLDSTSTLIRDQTNYSGVQSAGTDKSFAATLTNLVSASCSKTINASTQVHSQQVRTYQLQNSNARFRKAIKDPDTRTWVLEQIDDGYSDLYFVVGYHTMLDANVVLGATDNSGIGGEAAVPVSLAVTASTGIVLPAAGMLDPKVTLKMQEQRQGKVQFIAPGERVCAIQYRKVVFKWYSSRDLNKTTLEKENRWRAVDTLRQVRKEGEVEGEDVVEVDLEDEQEGGDSIGDVDSDLANVVDAEGVFLYPSSSEARFS
jgi:hypothetical protein